MKVRIGTSGYSYKAWRGAFYPEKLPESAMLSHYAQQFDTVEINNTFYRMPAAETLVKWADEVPRGFTFVLKAPQRITHHKRLANVGDEVAHFLKVADTLGSKLGPVLYQTPPHLKRDVGRLSAFLDLLPDPGRAAFEFRHDSWMEPDVRQLLADRGAVLCVADTDEAPAGAIDATGRFGYLRLRRAEYAEPDLERWAHAIHGEKWDEAYVFFKHEDEARGPKFAQALKALTNI